MLAASNLRVGSNIEWSYSKNEHKNLDVVVKESSSSVTEVESDNEPTPAYDVEDGRGSSKKSKRSKSSDRRRR